MDEPTKNLSEKTYSAATFEPAIQKIQSKGIQGFTRFALENSPDYFWTIPASTSGKFHGGETVVEHTLACLYLADKVCDEQLKDMDQRAKDVVRAALILHDTYRAGEPGNERKDENGKFRTNGNHPLVAARELKKLAGVYNTLEPPPESPIKNHEICAICNAISYHSGPFQRDYSKEGLNLPWSDIRDTEQRKWNPVWSYNSPLMLVHLIDYFDTMCSMYKSGK